MMLPNEPEPHPAGESDELKLEPESSPPGDAGTPVSADGLRPLEVATEMLCPRCHLTLQGGMLDTFPVAFCTQCHGVLIDHAGIGAVIRIRRSEYQGPEQTPKPFDPQALAVRGNCPNCGETMEAYPYGGPGNVVLDSCQRCGMVWLDHGEISTIVQSPGHRD